MAWKPVTERVWKYAEEANIPRFVVINQMDHPKAGGGGGLSALIDDLHERWGRNCVPVQIAHRRCRGIPWRRRPRDDGGFLLHAGMATAAARSRARFPRALRTQPRTRTRRWSSWSPKAKTS